MRTITTLAALAAIVALPACTSEASSAAGTYSVTLDTAGMPAEQVEAMSKMMTFGDLKLAADGTWSMSTDMDVAGMKKTNTMSGTWKLEGGQIAMTATHRDGKAITPETEKVPYKDGAFTIEREEAGTKMKMHMKKK